MTAFAEGCMKGGALHARRHGDGAVEGDEPG